MDLDLFLSHPVAYLKFYLANDSYNLEDVARVLGNLVLILWIIHIVDWGVARGGFRKTLGIHPRTVIGILGIFLAPFLHSIYLRDGEPDNSHIVRNTLFFVGLGWFIPIQGLNLFYLVTIGAALISGIGTWLFGAEGLVYAGASGVIYGYISFLFIYGFISRDPLAFVLGGVAFFLLLQSRWSIAGTSQIGHFFGFIGGIVMAYIVSYAKSSY